MRRCGLTRRKHVKWIHCECGLTVRIVLAKASPHSRKAMVSDPVFLLDCLDFECAYSGAEPITVMGVSLSSPDPRLNVGFRNGSVVKAGEALDDAVRLVYSGAPSSLNQESNAGPGEFLLLGCRPAALRLLLEKERESLKQHVGAVQTIFRRVRIHA